MDLTRHQRSRELLGSELKNRVIRSWLILPSVKADALVAVNREKEVKMTLEWKSNIALSMAPSSVSLSRGAIYSSISYVGKISDQSNNCFVIGSNNGEEGYRYGKVYVYYYSKPDGVNDDSPSPKLCRTNVMRSKENNNIKFI